VRACEDEEVIFVIFAFDIGTSWTLSGRLRRGGGRGGVEVWCIDLDRVTRGVVDVVYSVVSFVGRRSG
jgi:hypothetical protein